MEKQIKVGLAIMLFLCLADMPYGYFQLVRWAAMVGFSLLAFEAHKKNKDQEMIIYIGLAILFQPMIKIALGRTIWNFLDTIIAIWLLFSVKAKYQEKKNDKS
jgi:predicted membrane protein